MSDLLSLLNKIISEFNQSIESTPTQSDILNLKAKYLGKNGELNSILKQMKSATNEERSQIGKQANLFKAEIQEKVAAKLSELEKKEIDEKLKNSWIDVTDRYSLRDQGLQAGGLHPLYSIQREVEDIFLKMGFDILDGPHIEDEYHNFEALNIPSDHPARDMQDTFWFQDKSHLLRTHTSTIQVRGMKAKKPPFKFIAPGKCFRCERTDAFHESVFHQVEGMMVGEDISVSHLIYFMKTLLSQIFKKDVEIRLRPGFFPFVEPGFELDIKTTVTKEGKKKDKWLELLPCGMVHPNVLEMGGIDPQKYSGFAFGMGLDRLVMMRYGINDIRHLQSADLRFNEQFKTY